MDDRDPGRQFKINYPLAWTISFALAAWFATAVYNVADIKNRLSRLEDIASGVDPSRTLVNSRLMHEEVLSGQMEIKMQEISRRLDRLEDR